jgi:hypothetical protein
MDIDEAALPGECDLRQPAKHDVALIAATENVLTEKGSDSISTSNVGQ